MNKIIRIHLLCTKDDFNKLHANKSNFCQVITRNFNILVAREKVRGIHPLTMMMNFNSNPSNICLDISACSGGFLMWQRKTNTVWIQFLSSSVQIQALPECLSLYVLRMYLPILWQSGTIQPFIIL